MNAIKKYFIALVIILLLAGCEQKQQPVAIVIQTDFGIKDGAVAAMKGVAYEVDSQLPLFDLTHEIPAYNIWEAAYRLNQVVPYWPEKTVLVSVVDPGVGTSRRSVVAKTKNGQYIVTPDNGTLTLIAESPGIEAIREIDQKVNRRPGSEDSYTFHGRDVYMFTAARLASGKISFDEVGPASNKPLVTIPYQRAVLEDSMLKGNIPVLDIQYGNVWTNIPDTLIKKAKIKTGDTLDVRISFRDSLIFSKKIPYVNSFGDVQEGKLLAYINSLMNFSLAINMGSFADTHRIKSGPEWNVKIRLR
jgi:S-adenosylmethionine hydrolase